MMYTNRRELLSLGVTAAVLRLLTACDASARGPDNLEERFLLWSQRATGYGDLLPQVSAMYLARLIETGVAREDLERLSPRTYGGTPFEKRVLEGWFTGLLHREGQDDLRSFETTLMWRAAGTGVRPSECNGDPDMWAAAPPVT